LTNAANNALKYAKELALEPEYTAEESKFVISLSEFITQQAIHLTKLASEAANFDDSFL